MATVHEHDLVQAAPDEQQAIFRIERIINTQDRHQRVPKLLGPDRDEIELPESVFHLLRQLVHYLSQGRAVAVVSREQELTTQQAADILNVSRPYVIKLLEAGAIPYTRTGAHRRIRFDDLMVYKQQRDAERRRGLAHLTQMAEEMGDYD